MNKKQERVFQLISGMILALAFCGLVWFLKTRITFLLDSDDSSELVLGRLLASENRLLSKNWFYSTELRVVNTQIFYAFFFKLFNSWHKVRLASYVCLYIVMLAAYYFMCKGLKIRRYFLITAALLMLPFSELYFYFVLKGAYYIPHIAITFFTIGLCESYVACKNEKRKKIYLPLALLASILAGMGGARQVAILYIPLMLVAIGLAVSGASVVNGKVTCKLERGDKKYISFALISFAGAVIGYLINTRILAKIYSFRQWDNISFVGFDISNLSKIIDGFLSSYGYNTGKVFSSALLSNLLCMCWIFLTFGACVHILKKRKDVEPAHYRMALFTTAAFVIFILLYMFTDLAYYTRFDLPIIVLSIPMVTILFKSGKLRNSIKNVAITVFVLLIACSGFLFYKEEYKVDKTEELRNIASVLQNEQCTEGYATFWNANVLTELSNGVIDVWVWRELENSPTAWVQSIDDTYQWLQLTSHYGTHPKEPFFLIFTRGEWDNNLWTGKLSTEHIIYESDEYIVILYENYDKLLHDTTQP